VDGIATTPESLLEQAILEILDALPASFSQGQKNESSPFTPDNLDGASSAEQAIETTLVNKFSVTEGAPIVTLFNPLRPSIVSVIDPPMRDDLARLEPDLQRRIFSEQKCPRPWLLVLSECDEQQARIWRNTLALPNDIRLIASTLETDTAIGVMSRMLENRANPSRTLHGVFMEVSGTGVLLTGEPGVGKSELALELIARGHRLIADDAPIFRRHSFDTVEGHCPEAIRDLLEVRGIGLINVRELYGDAAVKRRKFLRLVVHLVPESKLKLDARTRLEGFHNHVRICGLDIAQTILPVAPGRNLAVMVEAVVRQHNLIRNGYSLEADLRARGLSSPTIDSKKAGGSSA